jgi:hypothetical protein
MHVLQARKHGHYIEDEKSVIENFFTFTYVFFELPPCTLAGFDLTTHTIQSPLYKEHYIYY